MHVQIHLLFILGSEVKLAYEGHTDILCLNCVNLNCFEILPSFPQQMILTGIQIHLQGKLY